LPSYPTHKFQEESAHLGAPSTVPRQSAELGQQAATSLLAAVLQVRDEGQKAPLPQEVVPLGPELAWRDHPGETSRAMMPTGLARWAKMEALALEATRRRRADEVYISKLELCSKGVKVEWVFLKRSLKE